ncbi:MAG: TolC family protein [Bacteroidaceae bacterium]|nr:TolC family protein [Bacteroidaceae bacterium]
MKITHYIFSLAVVAFAFGKGQVAHSQVAQKLTLEQCREQALQHNKTLSTAKLQIKKQEADLKAMKTNFLPNFNLMATDFYNTSKVNLKPDLNGILPGGMAGMNSLLAQLAASPVYAPLITGLQSYAQNIQMPDDFFEFKVGNVFGGSIMLTEPLYMGGKITAGYKMNQLGVQMANTNVRLKESDVLLQTDQAYVLCIRAKELGEVARSYRTLLLELQKNVEAAVRHGMKTRNDALKVQVKLNEAELNIVKADNASRLAQMNLAQIIGLPLTQQIDVTDLSEFSELSNPSDYSKNTKNPTLFDITRRPEYSLLSDKTDMARLQIKLTRSDFLPNVLLFGSYGYLHGMKLLGKTLFKSGSATVGVMLKVPLFHFGEGPQKIRSAKAAYQIALLEQEDLNEKMQLEALQASNNLREAALEIDLTQKSVEQAAENMRMSKQQYEVGTEPLSDYLESHANWQQASASAVEARCAYLLARSKYMKAIGER